MPALRNKPSLEDAGNTDEIHYLANELAWWGLRNGECDEYTALEWVMNHPHEAKLPRGSHGLNPTRHHITKGVERAVRNFIPGLRIGFDHEPLHDLAARVEGSGVSHERYLLAVIALCHRYETYTPVVTGPLLAEIAGVPKSTAGDVLRKWSDTLAYGFFTGISYDGVGGHGRVWTVNPGWEPVSKPKHLPGCNRSRSRCRCPGVSQSTVSISSAVDDRYGKVRQELFARWVQSLKTRTGITVTDAAKKLGITRHAATKLLRDNQGSLLDEGTWPGGRIRERRGGKWVWVNKGETWFTVANPRPKTFDPFDGSSFDTDHVPDYERNPTVIELPPPEQCVAPILSAWGLSPTD